VIIGGKTCRSCVYRHLTEPGAGVFCKRYPPQILLVPVPGPNGQMQPSIQSAYPTVDPMLPCGEYARSEIFATEEVSGASQGARPQ
jgi:hypothetical protein